MRTLFTIAAAVFALAAFGSNLYVAADDEVIAAIGWGRAMAGRSFTAITAAITGFQPVRGASTSKSLRKLPPIIRTCRHGRFAFRHRSGSRLVFKATLAFRLWRRTSPASNFPSRRQAQYTRKRTSCTDGLFRRSQS